MSLVTDHRMIHLAGARARIAVVVLCGGSFLASLDLWIVNVAFDAIGDDLHPASVSQLSWVLTGYTVVFAALLVPMGRLSDRYGPKLAFLGGLGLFTLASLACGLASAVWPLVALRMVQAVGAAAMVPSSLGLLVAALPPDRRAAAARLWSVSAAVAAGLGPVIGGGLVPWTWRAAFWINVPVGVALIVVGRKVVPAVRHNRAAPSPDIAGAALVAASVGALVLGFTQANDWGWDSPTFWGCCGAAFVGLATFWRRTGRHPSPIVDRELLRVPGFAVINLAHLAFYLAFAIGILTRVLWMERHWGYSATRTGLALAPGPVVVPVVVILAGRYLTRVAPTLQIALGSTAFAVAGVWQLLVIGPEPAYWQQMAGPWVLSGIGCGLALPNLVAVATSGLPAHLAGTGSGVTNMLRQIGAALGTAVMVGLVGDAMTPESFRSTWALMTLGCLAAAVGALWAHRSLARAAHPSREHAAAPVLAPTGRP